MFLSPSLITYSSGLGEIVHDTLHDTLQSFDRATDVVQKPTQVVQCNEQLVL
jgi:hypothetical protein